MNVGEVVAAYTVIEPRELRNVVMSDIQAAAIAHQSCDVCQAGCTARRRISFSCGHSVCEDCIPRLATGSSVTCSQCRRVATYSPTDESSHKAMLSLVKVRMSCDVETTLGDSEGHAKRCLPCMAKIAEALTRETASSLAAMRAKEDKIKRLSQANRRLQARNDYLRHTEDALREARLLVSELDSKLVAVYNKEQDLRAKINNGHRRVADMTALLNATKKHVALLTTKVRVEKKKKAESDEKAKHAISLLKAMREEDRAKKKIEKEADTPGDKQEGRAKKKAKKNGDTARGGSAIEGGGEEGAGGGGGGNGWGRCERCSKRGLPCNPITLRANAPSCVECRSKRIGCSFNWP